MTLTKPQSRKPMHVSGDSKAVEKNLSESLKERLQYFRHDYERRKRGGHPLAESGRCHVVMPIALCLVIDSRNGGDATARELIDRFNLLCFESGNAIDFYFLGWKSDTGFRNPDRIEFDLDAFARWRSLLSKKGIKTFGGNADLILVDAHFRWIDDKAKNRQPGQFSEPKEDFQEGISLDFSQAIHINLSSSKAAKEIPPLGEFLQMIIQAAGEVKKMDVDEDNQSIVFWMSDKLALATAKKSLLEFIFKKFGAMIGATKLAAITTRNLGPEVNGDDLELGGLTPKLAGCLY
jgi:hypothetical protein